MAAKKAGAKEVKRATKTFKSKRSSDSKTKSAVAKASPKKNSKGTF